MPTIPAHRRLRLEDCYEFKTVQSSQEYEANQDSISTSPYHTYTLIKKIQNLGDGGVGKSTQVYTIIVFNRRKHQDLTIGRREKATGRSWDQVVKVQ